MRGRRQAEETKRAYEEEKEGAKKPLDAEAAQVEAGIICNSGKRVDLRCIKLYWKHDWRLGNQRLNSTQWKDQEEGFSSKLSH